jgi:8-amino-7-oxononanoate synthase
VPERRSSQIETRAHEHLEELRARAELRTLDCLSGVDLCSNDYLGLARDPWLKHAAAEALANAQSVGSTGSRLLSGNTREWENLESEFAEFARTESALYFGSGYAANVGLLSSILKPGDVVFSDELNHASLIDGVRLSRATKEIYPHGDMDFLERALRRHSQSTGAKVIVSETLFSMEGDFAPIPRLVRLAHDYIADLILDEAHVTGVFGPQGRGLAAEPGVTGDVTATVHTCGKALASAGAFVCCSNALKSYLVNRARTFVFSTAMPPYFAGQIRAALELAIEANAERGHLRDVADLLRKELSASAIPFGASASQIIPVYCGTNEAALALAAHLQTSGFAARAIRPPTVPAGTARVRLSLTAKITRGDIERLVQAIRSAPRSLQSSTAIVMHA